MVLEGEPAKAETIGAALGCIFFFVTQLAIELSKWRPPACSGQGPTMSERPTNHAIFILNAPHWPYRDKYYPGV